MQTKGVKRQLVESKENLVVARAEESIQTVETLTEGLGRKRKRCAAQQKVKLAKRPDVVGFESESESESSSEEDSDPESDEDQVELSEPQETTDSQPVESPTEEKEEDPAHRVDTKPVVDDDDEVVEVTATSHKPSNLRTVSVTRPARVEEGRSNLPILGQEQEIMEMINNHGVLVLSGEKYLGVSRLLYLTNISRRDWVWEDYPDPPVSV